MLVLAVGSLVLSLGVPSFQGVVMDSRMVSGTNQFISAVSLARSSAVRYQRNATVCTSNDYSAATPTCSGSTNWSNGWVVWVDKDRDAAIDADEVVAAHGPVDGSTTMATAGTNRFTYDSRGFGISAADVLTVCDNRDAETGRRVTVNAVGRTSVFDFACS